MRSSRVKKVKDDLKRFVTEGKNLKKGDELAAALHAAKTERLTAFKEQVEGELEDANEVLA